MLRTYRSLPTRIPKVKLRQAPIPKVKCRQATARRRSFEHIGSYDLATDGGTLDVQAIGLEDELTIHEAKFVLGAENAPSSSTIDVRDEANAIAFGVDESFVSTLGSVHAENATIEQAGQFIETGYVNTISLNTYSRRTTKSSGSRRRNCH